MAVDAGSIISEVRIALDKLSGDISKVDSSIKVMGTKLDASTKTTATAMEANMKKGFQGINLAGVAAFAGIGLAVKGAAKLFIDFEQSLANVASVAGATEEEFRLIEQAALEAGETTRFTASQAADAMYYLASAGYDATQATQALNGVLLLAGSTGADLAFTAETMASALSQYNLEAEDAERVSNVFAATIANSQATMEKLAVSFRYVGPLASAFGISIEETSAALAILYNNGFEASQAGTALRSALADLSNATSPAIAKLEALGVSFEDVNPQTHSFAEVIDVLSQKVTDGSDIMAIFGDRAGPALIKLLEAGKSELEAYTDAVTGTNKAAEMYATQNDTLAGSLDRLKSAAESAAIKTGQELAPAFRSLVDFVTGLVQGFNALPGWLKAAAGGAVVLTAALVGLGVALPFIAKGLADIAITIGGLTLAGGPLFAIIAGIGAITGAVIGLTQAFEKQETEKIVKSYGDLAKQFNLTEKELVKLVKAAKSIDFPVEEFIKLKDETGLTVKELKNFVEVSRNVGVAAEELTALGKAWNLSAGDIQTINGRLMEQMALVDSEFVNIDDVIKNISRDLGLSKEQVSKVLLLNKDIDASLKSQAEKIIQNHDATMKAYEAEFARYAYIEAQKAGKGYLASKQAAELKAAELAQAEKDNAVAKQNADIKEATIQYEKSLVALKTQIADGTLTEKEALEEELKINKRQYETLLKLNNGYHDGGGLIDKLLARNKEIEKSLGIQSDTVNEYDLKLKQLDETTKQRIEREREAALLAAGTNEELIESINAYYDRLRDDEAEKEFLQNVKDTASDVKKIYDDLAGSVFGIFKSLNENRLAQNEEELQAALEAAGVAEETKLESLQRQLDEAKAAGDAETQADLEQQIKREQITQEYARKEAQIKYEQAQAEWYNNWINSIVNTAAAVVEALPNIPLSVSAGVAGAVQTGIILANPPKAPSFATGGIVIPSSSTGTMVNVAENGSPELLLNGGASGEAFLNQFASKIASIINSNSPNELRGIMMVGNTEMKNWVFKVIKDGSTNNEFSMNKQVLR